MRTIFRHIGLFLVSASLIAPPVAHGNIRDRSKSDGNARRWISAAQGRLAEIVELIENSNAPALIGHGEWRSLLAAHRSDIEAAPSHRVFAQRLNDLIEATGQSHFHYYTDDDWSFWHIISTFSTSGADTAVEHVGLFAEEIDGHWFVRGVFEGSAADGLGIGVGDEVLTVDGEAFEPIASFRGKAGQSVTLVIRRRPGMDYTVAVTPVLESLHHAVQRAIRESIQVVDYQGLRYAYLHAWTFLGSGSEYLSLLELQDDVDGLLWDLRDGFGGIAGRGTRFLLGSQSSEALWQKPAVILIDDGTRSAKEMLVSEVKDAGRAALVGMPTPGHVTSVGGFRRVGNDGLLMLPGQRFRLEGHPVTPHVQIDRPIPYSAGKDPQLDMGKLVLAKLIESYDAFPSTSR